MRHSLNFIQLILIYLLTVGGCLTISPIPPCNCVIPEGPNISNITQQNATITWTASSGVSYLKITNIENQTDTILSFSSTGTSLHTYAYTFSTLAPATTYSVQVKVPCGKGCTSLSDFSRARLFSTDANVNTCAQPVLFNVFNVKRDTMYISWQSVSSAQNYRLYITDSIGQVIYNQPFNITSTSIVNTAVIKTNLPNGDYTAWMEAVCGGNSTSVPSNPGVFGMRAGGGPIIVVEDDISIYKNPGIAGNILMLSTEVPLTSCIRSRNVSFLNTVNPRQILIGYRIPNNINAACAPQNTQQYRIRSYRVNGVQMNLNTPYYRVSIPRIGCICPGENYQIACVANDQFKPYVSPLITQYCATCP